MKREFCDWCDNLLPNSPVGKNFISYNLKATDEICNSCMDAFDKFKKSRRPEL